MKVLGIETSCDETAAAIVENTGNDGVRLLSNVVSSSLELHTKYGGVVPEIAARSHIEAITPVIEKALSEASCEWSDIDAIAVTYGAGLQGCLLIGVMAARTLALTQNKPLYGINHVEAHVYANFITDTALPGYKLPKKAPLFPILALIVSGGHSQLALFKDHFDYQLLGQTQDDAIGEAFDKVAKVIGLPYPGGPSIALDATRGNPDAFSFPKAKMPAPYDFSFSGVKTAVLRQVQTLCDKSYDFPSYKLSALLSEQQRADVAASFQKTAIETVVEKTALAYHEFSPASVVIAGGVASSLELRKQLSASLPIKVDYTDPRLCTDNGAMVASLGFFKHKLQQKTSDPLSLEPVSSLSM